MLTYRVPGRVLRALACCECSHVFSFAALQAQITEVPVRMEKGGETGWALQELPLDILTF